MTAAARLSISAPSGPSDASGETPPLPLKVKLSLLAICITTFLDLVGYMALMPSLIFYVRELGGTDSQYGLILSANSFAAFLCMPLYASWVDNSGNKFRKPLFVGQSLCVVGMLLYTLAIVFPKGPAVYVLLFSRILYGIGAASGSILMTYIASMVEPEQLSFVILVLSCAQGLGLGWGPFASVILADLDTTVTVMGLEIPLNPYDGVGVLIASFQIFGIVLLYFFLPEPPSKTTDDASEAKFLSETESTMSAGSWSDVFGALASDIRLLLPLFTGYVLSANYQLIEASFSPAAAHGLGWGPVETSEVLGYNSITMGFVTAIAVVLSNTYKVTDTTMIVSGNAFWFVAGIMMYSLWTYPAKAWHYVVPISMGMVGFPLIGPATQSTFSKAVRRRPALESIQARLQAVFAMAGEIANFTTPLIVGSFVLRSPQLVENGTNNHELTAVALYIPIFSGLCILGFLFEKFVLHIDDEDEDDEDDADDKPDEVVAEMVSESTMLLKKSRRGNRRSNIASIRISLSSQNESMRMRSSSIMGGNNSNPILLPFETPSEKKRREKLLEEKKYWEDLVKQAMALDAIESPAESDTEGLVETPAETPTETTSAGNKKLLVLISSYSANHQTKSNQDRALTILKSLKLGPDQMETIDGAAPANRDKRNELFGLSGIRAKYPQFFLVDASDTTAFMTDWEGFESMNEVGTLKSSMNLPIQQGDISSTETPIEIPTKIQAPSNKKLIVLISSYSSNPQQKSHQDWALTILKGLQLGPDQMETIDGAVAANREKRNKLFGLSGIRAKYPQFFLVDDSDSTKFLADYEGFEIMHEMGTLKESMNLA